MDNEIKIFLTTPEAIMFRDFQQFHQTFALLCEKGVFDCKNGKIEINFDETGEIGSIIKTEKIYMRGK